jgi:hypothetical protein
MRKKTVIKEYKDIKQSGIPLAISISMKVIRGIIQIINITDTGMYIATINITIMKLITTLRRRLHSVDTIVKHIQGDITMNIKVPWSQTAAQLTLRIKCCLKVSTKEVNKI